MTASSWAVILRDPTLSPVARLILLHQLDQPGDETVESLGTALNLGRDRITRGLGDLMVAGLAQRVVVTEAGEPPRAKWRFPQVGVSPTTGFPNYGLSQVGETPTTENPDLGMTSGFDVDGSRGVSRAPAPVFGINTHTPEKKDQEEPQNQEPSVEGGVGGDPDPALPKRKVSPLKLDNEAREADIPILDAAFEAMIDNAAPARKQLLDFAWAYFVIQIEGSEHKRVKTYRRTKTVLREAFDTLIVDNRPSVDELVAGVDNLIENAGAPFHPNAVLSFVGDHIKRARWKTKPKKIDEESEKKRRMGNPERHREALVKDLKRYTDATLKKKRGLYEEDLAGLRAEHGVPEPEKDLP